MRRPRTTAPAWPVHAGLLATVATAGTAYALAGPSGRALVCILVAAVPIVTFLLAVVSGRLPDRGPWLTAVAGLVLLFASQLIWPAWISEPHLGRGEASTIDLTLSAAHTLFLVGAAAALRGRARADRGGLIDATLFGLCAGGPLWEWVVRPQLSDSATGPGQMLLLVDLLVLSGVLGCVLRLSLMDRAGRGPLGYLVVTATLTLAAMITGAFSDGGSTLLSAELLLAAFLTMAAAAVHPGAPLLTVPPRETAAGSGRPRLGWLAAALSADPLIAAVQAVRGEGTASLLLPVGSLLVIPLVLLRIRQLSAQRDRAERTLAYHATHDELTGLRNRRYLTAELDRALDDLADGRLDEVTVLLCDLDGFKPVNDEYGHPAGDLVLRTVADRLAAAVRTDDLVGRLGGDEFLILCRGLTGLEGEQLKDRIAAVVAEPITLPGGTVTVGVTTGAAQARAGLPIDRHLLISMADAAMYAGKTTRRSRPADHPAPADH